MVDSSGLRPLHVGELPPQLAALNRTFLNVGELTVSAALEGRRDRVLQAALLDPNTAASLRIEQIEALVDDLIEAHGDVAARGDRRRRRHRGALVSATEAAAPPPPRARTAAPRAPPGPRSWSAPRRGSAPGSRGGWPAETWTTRLVLADIKLDGADELAGELGGDEAEVEAIAVDVTDAAAVDELVAATAEAERVVIAAGLFAPAPALEVEREEFARIFEVNTEGVFFVAQAYARAMAERGHGAIVGVASIAARMPRMRQTAYCSSKAGMRQALRVLGMEVAPLGVRVNTVSPGATDTPMMRALAADHSSVDDLAHGLDRGDAPADPQRPGRPARGRRRGGQLPARARKRARDARGHRRRRRRAARDVIGCVNHEERSHGEVEVRNEARDEPGGAGAARRRDRRLRRRRRVERRQRRASAASRSRSSSGTARPRVRPSCCRR